jgi:putative ABC transport system substrate-binding protein
MLGSWALPLLRLGQAVEAFRAALRDFGYVEGKNIIIDPKIDVLVTHGTPAGRAAKRATATIPIVMAITGDAIDTGHVLSLARLGGNITGFTLLNPELMAKRLELIKETVPGIAEVAVLLNPDNALNEPMLQAMDNMASSIRVSLRKFEARGPDEFDAAFSAMVKERVGAIEVHDDAMFLANNKAIAELAAKNRNPSSGSTEFAEAVGLISYGVNFVEMFRRAAYFVDKILRGAKPADLPVQRPTKFELVINLKTASALGISIPPSMVRADKVIE